MPGTLLKFVIVNSKSGCWRVGSKARLLPAAAAIVVPKLVTRS